MSWPSGKVEDSGCRHRRPFGGWVGVGTIVAIVPGKRQGGALSTCCDGVMEVGIVSGGLWTTQ